MNLFYEKFSELVQNNTPFVAVTLVDTIGSAPQEPGAKMLVTSSGLFFGTVGGGKVEARALKEAQALLENSENITNRFVQWSLNTDIGMTCGGTVKFYFEAFNRHIWNIVVFGAGHVGQALVRLLLNLDCRVTCIDSRSEWLEKLPVHETLQKICVDSMPETVAAVEENSFLVLMTMGHTTDKPILLEALKTRQFPYIGVIGSRAKAVQLKKDIEEAGLSAACKEKFFCPVGLDIGTNHPYEIAVSVVAQLLQVRDQLKEATKNG